MPKENADAHPQFDKCLEALIRIRDSRVIEDTIRIMAMNTINTMLESAGSNVADKPTGKDILAKIRGEA